MEDITTVVKNKYIKPLQAKIIQNPATDADKAANDRNNKLIDEYTQDLKVLSQDHLITDSIKGYIARFNKYR